jgi:hypothetical protein
MVSELRSKNLEFKVFFVHDNASGHLQVLGLAHPNIQVQDLSTVTTPHLQPLNRAIITTFQRYYSRRTFHIIFDAGEENTVKATQCLKSYSTADCRVSKERSLATLKSTTLNGCSR